MECGPAFNKIQENKRKKRNNSKNIVKQFGEMR